MSARACSITLFTSRHALSTLVPVSVIHRWFRLAKQPFVPLSQIETYFHARARQITQISSAVKDMIRRHPAHQRFCDMVQRALWQLLTRHAVGFRGVLAVFYDDVEIEQAHLNGAEAHPDAVPLRKIIGFVGFQDIVLLRFRAATANDPAPPSPVSPYLLPDQTRSGSPAGSARCYRYDDSCRQRVPESSETAISAGVVGRRHHRHQNIRAQFVHHILRRNGVTDGFGHFAALTIHSEAVGQVPDGTALPFIAIKESSGRT